METKAPMRGYENLPLSDDLDEMFIEIVNESVSNLESTGASPAEIDAFLDWYVPDMAAEKQRMLERVIAAIPESILVTLGGSGHAALCKMSRGR
jgi:hypothetical protein